MFTNTFMYFCITCFRTSALKYTLTSAVSNYFSTIPIIEQNKFKIALLTDVNYTSWKKRPINTYGCRQIIRIKEIWITTKHKVNVVYFLNTNTFKVSSRALQKVPWSCDYPLMCQLRIVDQRARIRLHCPKAIKASVSTESKTYFTWSGYSTGAIVHFFSILRH